MGHFILCFIVVALLVQEDLLVMGGDFPLSFNTHIHTNQMCIYKNLGDMGSVVGGPCIIGRGVRIILILVPLYLEGILCSNYLFFGKLSNWLIPV